MSLSPMYVGSTSPVWTPTVLDDSGAAKNLTGATITLTIRNVATGVEVAGAGTWTIPNPTAGQAQYAWGASDTAAPGSFLLKVKITGLPGGQLEADPVPWEILPA